MRKGHTRMPRLTALPAFTQVWLALSASCGVSSGVKLHLLCLARMRDTPAHAYKNWELDSTLPVIPNQRRHSHVEVCRPGCLLSPCLPGAANGQPQTNCGAILATDVDVWEHTNTLLLCSHACSP